MIRHIVMGIVGCWLLPIARKMGNYALKSYGLEVFISWTPAPIGTVAKLKAAAAGQVPINSTDIRQSGVTVN